MNRRNHAFDEHQWQAQEHARSAVRDGRADADAGELRVARALREAPPMALPADFAARVATLARARAAASSLLEQRLLCALGCALGVSAAAVVVESGRGWVAELAALLPGGVDATGWVAATALCLLANWGWGALRRPHAARDEYASKR
ncbi:hypothetical protein [Luteimonas aquatica]|uniref:hypothetical protein n=1 Tax=Luteimonas aquatica TaxID=450364 RepID=UPI001F589A39|nr:hypothetical protein [Luteimonas aquatica]